MVSMNRTDGADRSAALIEETGLVVLRVISWLWSLGHATQRALPRPSPSSKLSLLPHDLDTEHSELPLPALLQSVAKHPTSLTRCQQAPRRRRSIHHGRLCSAASGGFVRLQLPENIRICSPIFHPSPRMHMCEIIEYTSTRQSMMLARKTQILAPPLKCAFRTFLLPVPAPAS